MRDTVMQRVRWAAEHLAEGLNTPWVSAVLTVAGRDPELLTVGEVPGDIRVRLLGREGRAIVRGAPRSAEPITATLGADTAGALPMVVVVPIVAEVGLAGAFFAPVPERVADSEVLRRARVAGSILLHEMVEVSSIALERAMSLHALGRPVGNLVCFDGADRIVFAHAGEDEVRWPVLGSLRASMEEAAPDEVHHWEEDGDEIGGLLRIEAGRELAPWESDTAHLLGLALRVVNLSEQLDRCGRGEREISVAAAEEARTIARTAMAAVDADQVQEVDVGPVLDEAREWFEPVLRSDGVQVIALGGVDLPEIAGNRYALRHTFWILIDRIRRTRKGTGGIVSCRAWAEADHVLIAVSDNGRGVPTPETRPLYESWPGADTEEDPVDPHGLEALQRLLRPMGATLEVESRPRIWTRFTIRFPVAAPKPVEAPAPLAAAVHVRDEVAGGLEVLVVDDNHQIRDVLRRFLVRLGHTVTLAEDGELAMEMVRTKTFDRILLDVNMPGKDGPSFYQSLDERAPELQNRTIFMTGGVVEEAINGFIRDTGCPRLGKPFMLDELIQVLQA